jgi:hypothetical protein
MSEINFLSHSAMAEPRTLSSGPMRHLSIETFILAATKVGSCLEVPNHVYGGRHRSGSAQSFSLRKESVTKYFDCYIDEFIALFPMLDRDHAIADLDDVLLDHLHDSTTASPSRLPLRDFNTYMAIAIGAVLLDDSFHNLSFAAALHLSAMEAFPVVLRTASDLEIIKSLFLLTVFSVLSASGGSAWHLAGLAMKKCVTLRMHKVPDANSDNIPSTELGYRNQLFWNLYILDRYGTFSVFRFC